MVVVAQTVAWELQPFGCGTVGSAEMALGRSVAAVLGASEGYLVLVEL
jgi:hypothetical protein